jgi:ABC-type hemin transport system ATPase subunit
VDGRLAAFGDTRAVLTEELIEALYHVRVRVRWPLIEPLALEV